MKKIHFDKKAFDAELAAWKNLVDVVNAFGSELKPHSLELSSELLSEFMSGVVIDPISGIKKGHPFQNRLLDATLSRLQASTPLMVQGFTREAESIAKSFDHYRDDIRRAASHIGIDPATVTIKDGRAVIGKALKDEIRERHTAYLADRDAEAYERMQKFAMSLNELREFLDKEMPPLTLVDPL
ncbi:MAG TPA: hypothetical protein ENO27_02795, partial [Caldithrix sp.]|nr:hypothetical protein [Caldithrix sp.]